jgi:hypothetical protein
MHLYAPSFLFQHELDRRIEDTVHICLLSLATNTMLFDLKKIEWPPEYDRVRVRVRVTLSVLTKHILIFHDRYFVYVRIQW